MGVVRSSFYVEPEGKLRDEEIVAEIRAITDAFEGYGYRRVDAELRHRCFVVNAKKVRRLMREPALNPRRRRRFVRTTDSDHDDPIHPFVAGGFEVHGSDHLWVADLTYVAIAARPGEPHVAINGSGRSSSLTALDWFLERGMSAIPDLSPLSITVPGAVAAWAALSERHGRLSLDRLPQPAIRAAEDGYVVTPRMAVATAAAAPTCCAATRRRPRPCCPADRRRPPVRGWAISFPPGRSNGSRAMAMTDSIAARRLRTSQKPSRPPAG